MSDVDAWNSETDRVTLMTLHAAKGLEFPVVFIVALEEGIIPHERSRHEDDMLEEERRLLFVGMTRAQEELQLSRAMFREFRGQRRMTIPSPFLGELPRHEMRIIEPIRPARSWDQPAPEEEVWQDPHGGAVEQTAPAGELVGADLAGDEAATDSAISFDPNELGKLPVAALLTAAELERASATAAALAEIARGGSPQSHLATPAGTEFPPEVFTQGMLVRHPQYGLGKIVALSGRGVKRAATIDFASAAGQKKFNLASSPLRPAKSI